MTMIILNILSDSEVSMILNITWLVEILCAHVKAFS